MSEFEPGRIIDGRYTIVRCIGRGGMGGVYEVTGSALQNRMALKIIRPEYANEPSFRARFEREAKIQSALDHPNIGKVVDLVSFDGMLAIVMEYIDAPTLRALLSTGPLPIPQTRAILREVCVGLAVAHDAKVVHRDLKPENLFVRTSPRGRVTCKLIDFGIAKGTPDASRHQTTLQGSQGFVGTYAYASPEQITHTGPIDHRSDLYSLGVLLWEMLSGIKPYDSVTSAYAVQTHVVNDALPELPSTVPEDLRLLVVELTRKSPAERPQSAGEVLDRLDGHVQGLDNMTALPGVSTPAARPSNLTPTAHEPPTGAARTADVAPTAIEPPPISSPGAATRERGAPTNHEKGWPQPLTAMVLEVGPGVVLSTFGLGHLYAGDFRKGFTLMVTYWALTMVNAALTGVLIGYLTWPLTLAYVAWHASNSAREAAETRRSTSA